MRILTCVFLLCLFFSVPTSANTSAHERHQPRLQFSSFDLTAKTLKQYKPNTAMTIRFNHSIYRATLSEILVYQLLSLALVVSFFYLYSDQ
jgi:hypothetical protein